MLCCLRSAHFQPPPLLVSQLAEFLFTVGSQGKLIVEASSRKVVKETLHPQSHEAEELHYRYTVGAGILTEPTQEALM